MRHAVLFGFSLTAALVAASKPVPSGKGGNASVELSATLYNGREAVKEVLGSDLGGFYVVVEVKLAPKAKLAVLRDDFTLRTDRDGEKSKPFAPSQIAGRGVMVVSQTGTGGGMQSQEAGPVWGGIGGGRPRRMGGDGASVGNAGGTATQATINTSAAEKENPLMAVLSQKLLAEKESDQPVSGLLYFPMEPKQKPKDLELIYTAPTGKISLRFK